jgi:hypothetical protein
MYGKILFHIRTDFIQNITQREMLLDLFLCKKPKLFHDLFAKDDWKELVEGYVLNLSNNNAPGLLQHPQKSHIV